MIYRNWFSVFLIKKSVFLIKNWSKKRGIRSCLSKIDLQKSIFFTKNRSFLSKIGLQKSVFFIKNQSFGGVETRWLGWQFLDGL